MNFIRLLLLLHLAALFWGPSCEAVGFGTVALTAFLVMIPVKIIMNSINKGYNKEAETLLNATATTQNTTFFPHHNNSGYEFFPNASNPSVS